MAASKARTASKFEARKALIVRAAVGVINRKGVSGMTLADVAEQLELVPTAVNYYFRRKEDLAVACFLHAIDRYNQLIGCADPQDAPQVQLDAFLTAFARYAADVARGEADAIVSFNDVRAIRDLSVDAAYTDMFRRIRRVFTPETVGEGGRIARSARTHLLISQVFWSLLWLQQFDPDDYVRMVSRLREVLVEGLAAPGAVWAPREIAGPAQAPEAAGGSLDAFLRAATEMLNAHGYVNASVSRIAARLNVTKGSFYHHLQAKDDLVERCFDRTLRAMREAQLEADGCGDGLAVLSSLTASLVRHEVSGEVPLLRTSALTTVPEAMRLQLEGRFGRFSARLASVICDGVADRSVRAVDANVGAQALTSLINAGAELRQWTPDVTAETAAEVFARPLFFGLFRPQAAVGSRRDEPPLRRSASA